MYRHLPALAQGLFETQSRVLAPTWIDEVRASVGKGRPRGDRERVEDAIPLVLHDDLPRRLCATVASFVHGTLVSTKVLDASRPMQMVAAGA
jgi:hypothetical protein